MNKKIEFMRKIRDYYIFYDENSGDYVIYYDLPENTIKKVENKPHYFYDYIACRIYDDANLDLEGFIQELDRNFSKTLEKINRYNQNA